MSDEIASIKNRLLEETSSIEKISLEISERYKNSESHFDDIDAHYTSLKKHKEIAQPLVDELSKMGEIKTKLDIKFQTITSLSNNIEGVDNKSRTLLAEIISSKKKIQEICDVIFGYTPKLDQPVSNIDELRVKGLKEKLDDSYVQIEKDIKVLTQTLSSIKDEATENHENLFADSKEQYDNYQIECEKTYNATVKKLKSLLPEALTAGLASAYEKKTASEEKELANHKKTFDKAIIGLVIISLIPFLVNGFRIIQNNELDLLVLIKDMPYLVFAMMPLYIPILWIAYSAKKSYKLAKRLIEEYSHKGVVSRTFEGLANQINEIDNSELSQELRTQLLFNLVTVNSENPGKLISDYNKSDHPLMDALEKSSQMATSLSKLARIPGFSKIAENLSDKGKKVIEIEDKKISSVIDRFDEEASLEKSSK